MVHEPNQQWPNVRSHIESTCKRQEFHHVWSHVSVILRDEKKTFFFRKFLNTLPVFDICF